jgi:hypothetical protein
MQQTTSFFKELWALAFKPLEAAAERNKRMQFHPISMDENSGG